MSYIDLVSNLPGAKVLGIVIPDAPKVARRKRPKIVIPPPPSKLYAPGEVVARFTVRERAVPWKVTMRGRAAPSVKLGYWTRHVQKAARQVMAGRLPHSGRFELRLTFRLKRMPSNPDATNVLKSTEDACQGIVFTNDRNASRIVVDYDPDSEVDETTIEVIAL